MPISLLAGRYVLARLCASYLESPDPAAEPGLLFWPGSAVNIQPTVLRRLIPVMIAWLRRRDGAANGNPEAADGPRRPRPAGSDVKKARRHEIRCDVYESAVRGGPEILMCGQNNGNEPDRTFHASLRFSPSRKAIDSSSTRTASSMGMTGRASKTKAGSIEQNCGPLIFLHACKFGLEGIVSERATRFIVRAVRRTGSNRKTRMHRL